MKTRIKISAVCAALALMAGSVYAVPLLLDWQDGTLGNEYNNWSAIDEVFGNTTQLGALNVNGGGGTDLDGEQAMLLAVDTTGTFTFEGNIFATTDFAGNYANYGGLGPVLSMEFDFYASDVAPAGLGFFFLSGNNYWYYDIDTSGLDINEWDNFSVTMTFGGPLGWYGLGNNNLGNPLNSGNFASDLGSVASAGFYIIYQTDESQSYGIANYELWGDDAPPPMMIPEPETYVVLGIALLSVAFVFRKKITDSLAEARAMIQM